MKNSFTALLFAVAACPNLAGSWICETPHLGKAKWSIAQTTDGEQTKYHLDHLYFDSGMTEAFDWTAPSQSTQNGYPQVISCPSADSLSYQLVMDPSFGMIVTFKRLTDSTIAYTYGSTYSTDTVTCYRSQ